MRRAILAVLGFAPIVWMLSIVLFVFILDWDEPYDPDWLTWLMTGGTAIYLAGLVLYIFDAWRNPSMPADKRALWTAVLFFAGPYAMPFYFWHYVRP